MYFKGNKYSLNNVDLKVNHCIKKSFKVQNKIDAAL
jgi:hypothetical protein